MIPARSGSAFLRAIIASWAPTVMDAKMLVRWKDREIPWARRQRTDR